MLLHFAPPLSPPFYPITLVSQTLTTSVTFTRPLRALLESHALEAAAAVLRATIPLVGAEVTPPRPVAVRARGGPQWTGCG